MALALRRACRLDVSISDTCDLNSTPFRSLTSAAVVCGTRSAIMRDIAPVKKDYRTVPWL